MSASTTNDSPGAVPAAAQKQTFRFSILSLLLFCLLLGSVSLWLGKIHAWVVLPEADGKVASWGMSDEQIPHFNGAHVLYPAGPNSPHGKPGSIIAWNAASGQHRVVAPTLASPNVQKLLSAPDGKQLLVISDEAGPLAGGAIDPFAGPSGEAAAAQIFAADGGAGTTRLAGKFSNADTFLYLPDGRIAVNQSGVIRLFDGAGKEVLCCEDKPAGDAPPSDSRLLIVSNDGTKLLSLGRELGIPRLWDLKTGKQLAACPGHTGGVQTLALSADARRICSSAEDGTLRIWDAGDGRELAQTKRINKDPYYVQRVDFVKDCQIILVADSGGGVYTWDYAAGRTTVLRDGVNYGSNNLHLSARKIAPDGRRLLIPNDQGAGEFWDLATGARIDALQPLGEGIHFGHFVDDERVVTVNRDGTFSTWQRVRPEGPLGMAMVPGVWVSVALFIALFCNLLRDRRH